MSACLRVRQDVRACAQRRRRLHCPGLTEEAESSKNCSNALAQEHLEHPMQAEDQVCAGNSVLKSCLDVGILSEDSY